MSGTYTGTFIIIELQIWIQYSITLVFDNNCIHEKLNILY